MKGEFRGRGQSTLELLIALGILVVSMSAAIAVYFGGQSLTVDTAESREATYLARGLLEAAREQARQNFAGVVSSSSTQNEFTKETIVENVDATTKKVTSRVKWTPDPLRLETVELVTYLTDWRNVAPPPDPGDAGGGGISGDWRNPRTLGSVDLGPGNQATDLDVISKIVYMTSEASASSKPDFYVVNATDGQNPYIVSSLDVGVAGLAALDVSGSYAYTVEKNNHQVRIIDVSNPANPVVASTFHLEGTGEERKGLSIFYTAGKVYVGTTGAPGPEFHILDVSNPFGPAELGSYEVGADVWKIYVSGNYAYLATGDSARELLVLDVSNPASISQYGAFNAMGTAPGKSDFLVGTRLYLGRLGGSDKELLALDVGTSSPQNLGATEVGSDINDLYVRNTLAFLATSDSNREFQVWNVTDPASSTLWSSFNFPQVATGLDYEDNIVYVSVRSNDALRIITSSP